MGVDKIVNITLKTMAVAGVAAVGWRFYKKSIKNFIVNHQTEITLTTIAVLVTFAAIKISDEYQLDKFLVEHDLYETYYGPNGLGGL